MAKLNVKIEKCTKIVQRFCFSGLIECFQYVLRDDRNLKNK